MFRVAIAAVLGIVSMGSDWGVAGSMDFQMDNLSRLPRGGGSRVRAVWKDGAT